MENKKIDKEMLRSIKRLKEQILKNYKSEGTIEIPLVAVLYGTDKMGFVN